MPLQPPETTLTFWGHLCCRSEEQLQGARRTLAGAAYLPSRLCARRALGLCLDVPCLRPQAPGPQEAPPPLPCLCAVSVACSFPHPGQRLKASPPHLGGGAACHVGPPGLSGLKGPVEDGCPGTALPGSWLALTVTFCRQFCIFVEKRVTSPQLSFAPVL